MSTNLEVKLVHSPIGCPEDQRATVRGLGLRKLQQCRTLKDTAPIRGMIEKVKHLVSIQKKGK